MDLSASSRVMRCSGYQPPGGQLSASCREMAEWNEISGLTCSTGKSLPFGIATPVLRRERHGYAPVRRPTPSREPIQYMSLVWWLACIDGMTRSEEHTSELQ